jgi:hypothetical protein
MVANQPMPEAMIDQPGVAVRTGEPVAASATECQRRIAAPVEKQQRLFVALKREANLVRESRRDVAAARRSLASEVDGLDCGQILAAEPLRQPQAPVAATPGVHFGLDRRRRGRKRNRDVCNARAHHGHVARVIAHAVLLLVGRVMLLVDDDEAEVGIRQEQRRPGAGNNTDLPGRYRGPGSGALTR